VTSPGLTAPISADVQLLAEDQSADYAPWPGSQLIHGPGFDIWFGPAYYPGLTVVRHIRLPDGGAVDGVRAARSLIRSRGRNQALWSVGASATPDDIVEGLGSFGMRPDSDPVLKAVVLRSPPDDVPTGIVVRRASSLDDFVSFFAIQQEAFEIDPDVVARGLPFVEQLYDAESSADHIATYLAFLDGEPIATARATFTDAGVILNGGSTLHRARRCGAYRALVAARWSDAVARGTPHLTTLARPTSYPILKRLGFVDVCDVQMLVDEF
jgi:hypothetical protein